MAYPTVDTSQPNIARVADSLRHPKTFQGPFITLWTFGQYLLPLAVLELYLRARDRAGAPGRIAMAAGLCVLTVAMGVGIFVATVGMWLPNI